MAIGFAESQEIAQRHQIRDLRSGSERLYDWLKEPSHTAATLASFAVLILLLPPLTELVSILGAIIYLLFGPTKSIRLPLRVPGHAGFHDRSYGAPKVGEGIFFVGNQIKADTNSKGGEEIWEDNSDCRTHIFVFGTTGSGKTELLLAFLYCAICWGSGVMFVDGKGTPKLYAQIYAIARHFGREDDVRLLNLMIGRFDPRVKRARRISNKMNVLASGSGAFLTELIVSLMPESGGDGATWKDRAINMASGVINAAVFLRDRGDILLTPGVIREYMTLAKVVELAGDKRGIYRFPQPVFDALNAYLAALPGYNPQKPPHEQSSTTRDQHGYLQMQFTKIMGQLTDVYGHIFNCEISEIHMEDVALQNRIFVGLIPSLEKSDHENRALGNIAVASARAMMSAVMGSEVAGDAAQLIETLPTESPVPFPSIWDEVGYFLPKSGGTAVMPAQARSLGQMMIFAGQDKPGVNRAGKEEADSMVANTSTKICLKCEDTGETLDLFQKRAGEGTVAIAGSSEKKPGLLKSIFVDSGDARQERRQRLTVDEVTAYAPGQGAVIFGSKLIRFESLYTNIKPNRIRVNALVQIRYPRNHDLDNMGATRREREIRLNQIQGRLLGAVTALKPCLDLGSSFAQRYATLQANSGSQPPQELALAAWLLTIDKQQVAPTTVPESAVPTNADLHSSIDDNLVVIDGEIFDGTFALDSISNLDKPSKSPINNIDTASNKQEILTRDLTAIGVEMGNAPDVAAHAAELVKSEIDSAVSYPDVGIDMQKLVNMANELDVHGMFDELER